MFASPSFCLESVKYSLLLFQVCHNDGFYLLFQNFLPAELRALKRASLKDISPYFNLSLAVHGPE